jgi:hypothetical protein
MHDEYIIQTLKTAMDQAIQRGDLPSHAPTIKLAFDGLTRSAKIHLIEWDNKKMIVIGEPGIICPHCHGTGRV